MREPMCVEANLCTRTITRRALKRLKRCLALRRAYALLLVYHSETHPHLYRAPVREDLPRPWEWEELA